MKILAIRDSYQTGYVNMAADLCSMKFVQNGNADVVFRTYMWSPHCLSIGRFQKPEQEADIKKLLRDGYHIVRRPTGGRAVWHAHELTYSLVAKENHPLVSGTISESLEKVAGILTEALKKINIPAVLNPTTRELSTEGRAFNPCFTSHGRAEIMTPDGRKLVGSAQARSKGVFIEHGSILFTNQQSKAVDYLPSKASGNLKNKMRNLLNAGVGSILEYNKNATPEILSEYLHDQFSEQVGSQVTPFFSGNLPFLKETVIERKKIIESY